MNKLNLTIAPKLVQQQKLILTQELQLFLKLIQMNTLELKEYLDEQLVENPTLEETEDALIDHEAHSQQAIIEARLTAKTVALSDYLNAQHELSNVIDNARVLHQQLDEHPASAPASLGDDLTVLLLEIQGLSRNTELPLQLQIASGGSLSNRTVKEQADALGDLITALEIRLAEIEGNITAPDTLE